MKPMHKGIATIAAATGATILAISLFGGKDEAKAVDAAAGEATATTEATTNSAEQASGTAATTGNKGKVEPQSAETPQSTSVVATPSNSASLKGGDSIDSSKPIALKAPVEPIQGEASKPSAPKMPEQPTLTDKGVVEASAPAVAGEKSEIPAAGKPSAPSGLFSKDGELAGKPSAPATPTQPVMAEKNEAATATSGSLDAAVQPASSTASAGVPKNTSKPNAPETPAQPVMAEEGVKQVAPETAKAVPNAETKAPSGLFKAGKPAAPLTPAAPSQADIQSPTAPVTEKRGVSTPIPVAPGVVSMGIDPMKTAETGKPVAPSQAAPVAQATSKKPEGGQPQTQQMNMNMSMPMSMPSMGGQGTPRIIYVPVPVYSQQPQGK